jgi:hypothetical protein
MSGTRTAVAVIAATVLAGGALVAAQQPAAPARGAAPAAAQAPRPATTQAPSNPTVGQLPSNGLPLTPSIREHGSGVTPAFEGWFHGKDGFDYVMAGYFNRNTKEEFDIPVGPNNHIDPGGPDQGQPTHFYLGRQWGVITIKLPKDFGQKKLVWTLIVNGQTNQISLHTPPVYIVEPYGSSWNNNTPPVLKLTSDGQTFTGPPIGFAANMMATVGTPLPLTAWITDDNVGRAGDAAPAAPGAAAGRGARGAAPAGAAAAPADAIPQAPAAAAGGAAAGRGRGPGGRGGISVTWAMQRNPVAGGKVTFASNKPAVDAANGGKTETTATFDKPGDYVIRVQGNDSSGDGGGGEQCCWTNGLIKVAVK